MMLTWIALLGQQTLNNLAALGKFTLLGFKLAACLGFVLKRFSLCVKQMYILGNQSLIIMLTAGFFVGLVLALQGHYTLNRYGSGQILGLMVALALLRELGPVITALLFAGRAGSALSAEIGLMKAGEQLDALSMMAISPYKRILAPRFWAGILVLPGLTLIFNMVAIIGAYLMAVHFLKVDANGFWSHMQSGVLFGADVMLGLLKSLVFGMVTTLTAIYQGFYAKPTPEGVSKASTNTVVWGCLATLAFDFLLTSLFFIN